MVRVSKLFVGDYIRGTELKGKEVTVEILGEGEIVDTQFKDYKQRVKRQLMLPVRFQGEIRKLGINKTSLKRIALEYSEDSEKWVNKRLLLKPQVRNIGENEVVVIWVSPVKEDSVMEDLFSSIKKKPSKDVVEETQEEKDNWEGI